jgi:hypothetical protein
MPFPFSWKNKASKVNFCHLNSIYYSQLFHCHFHVWMFLQTAVAAVVSIQNHCLDGSGFLACSCSEFIHSESMNFTVGRTPCTGDQATMPQVEFEPTM